ncbi:hypothetical protein [Leclercia adecarboxylata]|nr:hypothetical protein [Leclercia adecarboxylata]MDV5505789.1 hypothetical protein [Leclercia adecarboxylata]
MNDNELNRIPATALKVMAAQIEERGGRVFFRGNKTVPAWPLPHSGSLRA